MGLIVCNVTLPSSMAAFHGASVNMINKPQVTVLIPHYKTLLLTKLCLRLIRKHTDLSQLKVMVIDNGSADESSEYLRSVAWIELIERQPVANEKPAEAHARALDLGLSHVTTPYVLSIHTDTLIKNPQWLSFLIAEIEKDAMIAGVGSWKLEFKPLFKCFSKIIERFLQFFYYQIMRKNDHQLEGLGKNYYYLRSHCAMYRTDLLKIYQLHFADGDMVAGKYLHQFLIEKGYQMVFLPESQLAQYLEHINHATMVLNPGLGSRQKSINRGLIRIEKSLQRFNAKEILEDVTLDGI